MENGKLKGCITGKANEILEQLAKVYVSGRQARLILFILRESYGKAGWQTQQGWGDGSSAVMNLESWAARLMVRKANLCKTRAELVERHILSYNPRDNRVAINTNFSEWLGQDSLLPSGQLIIQSDNAIIESDNQPLSSSIIPLSNPITAVIQSDNASLSDSITQVLDEAAPEAEVDDDANNYLNNNNKNINNKNILSFSFHDTKQAEETSDFQAKQIWIYAKERMKDQVNHQEYLSWIATTEGGRLKDNTLLVFANARFLVDHLNNRYQKLAEECTSRVMSRPIEVVFATRGQKEESP